MRTSSGWVTATAVAALPPKLGSKHHPPTRSSCKASLVCAVLDHCVVVALGANKDYFWLLLLRGEGKRRVSVCDCDFLGFWACLGLIIHLPCGGDVRCRRVSDPSKLCASLG